VATRLNKDFTPTEQTLNNLRKHGAIPEFVDHELEMFKAYFLDPDLPDSKAKKSSWQMTLQRWMRSAWQGKAGRDWEYNRHKRQDSGGSGDLFDAAFAKWEKDCPVKNPQVITTYRIPERPAVEVDPNKTTEDYLNELAKII